MNNLKPNKTDEFFRQTLIPPTDLIPSDKDWKDMEGRLKNQPKRRFVAWVWPVGIAAALLIFFSVWLSTESTEPLNQQAKDKLPAKPSEINTNKENALKNKNSDPSNNKEHLNSNTRQLLVESKNNLDNSFISYKQTIPNQVTPEPSRINNFFHLSPAKAVKINNNIQRTLVRFVSINPDQFKLKNSLLKDTISLRDKAPEQDLIGKLAVSLAFSPDLNTVKGIGNSSLGLSLGGGLNYKISKFISVGTGLYYSDKRYTSDKTSYKVKEKPFATWTSYSKQIDADCKVLDIPVNLNIRMLSNANANILASAGISSYIMLSEKYNFIYNSNPLYPSPKREYSVRNANKHILSVVNLSIGMEKPLTKQTSLLIMPYAKIPLTGIGQGETDLKSFGIGFQLNYSMKKKNKFFKSEP